MKIETRPKLRKHDRREQILQELRLRPHVRIAELSERFRVSTETIRRDFEKLSADGLLDRAHGGASAVSAGRYPTFEERSAEGLEQRERIGRQAARLVQPGETLMIDSGSTTLQCARFLAFDRTPCTVVTNSFPVAMALGQCAEIAVIACPGDYLPSEAAVIGTDTVEFLQRHAVDRCFIGASGLTDTGPAETVRGFAAIKRAMLACSVHTHLLADAEKFNRRGLAQVGRISDLTSVVCDTAPPETLMRALEDGRVDVVIAD